jgi:cobaltochelatase CobS
MAMAHELTGFVDAGGTYHETVFVKRFRDGGLCLLDELDSWSAEATLCLNAALANGEVSLPTGEIVSRHPDFACVGAGNTWGQGATAEFVGRNRLDAAFLSRFAVKLAWGYDEKLESEICGNPAWARRVQKARAAAAKAGIKAVIDPRTSMAGAALIAAGFSEAEAADMTYLAGLPEAQRSLIEGAK